MALSDLTYEVHRPFRWDTLLGGLVINCAGTLLLAGLGRHMITSIPRPAAANSQYVTLVAPRSAPKTHYSPPRSIPTPVQVSKVEAPKFMPGPAPHQAPRIEAPSATPAKPELPEIVASAPPAIPAKSVPEVKTNVFSSAKSEVATVRKPPGEVQTGGFGDPEGTRGQGDPKRNTLTSVAVGSFEAPVGPGAGNGNGGSHGVSGIVRSAGFGDGAAASRASASQGHGTVGASGFDAVAENQTLAAKQVEKKPDLQPIEITYKPRPAYTAEAIRERIEGEVLLEVVFKASGSLHVNRVVKGLGYGLDDMALAAAQRIRFRPARRDGQPYDCAALVHIVFELAK